MNSLSTTRKNLKLSRTLKNKGGILIGGKDKEIILKKGKVKFKNIYGKIIPEITVNRRS